MDIDKVIKIFTVYAPMNESEIEKYRQLIQTAVARVSSRVLRAPQNENEKRILEAAAAAEAFRDYVILEMTRESAEITAGDISIRQQHGEVIKLANLVYNKSMEDAGYMLSDRTGFVFMRVTP
ncbi:MAG: hypothetical protein IJY56_00920 [Clostridia bacterium]|nr:hypothetical protein [Clostridia bacterium]